MKIKLLEIRDRATFIPVLAIDMNEPANDAERFLLRSAGYALDGYPIIMFTNAQASGGPASYDPFTWPNRTFRHAHEYVTAHWHELESGDVVDVEHVLGETTVPKISERFDNLFDQDPPDGNCPHGNDVGHCDACDQAGDLAFDAAREARVFGR